MLDFFKLFISLDCPITDWIMAVAAFGALIVAISAKSAWKEELRITRKKELADKLLDIVNFLEWQYRLRENQSQNDIEYIKALNKYGTASREQNYIFRLKNIKIELSEIKEAYNSFVEKDMCEKIQQNIAFIDEILNSYNPKGCNMNEAEFEISDLIKEASNLDFNSIKTFCKTEQNKFYSK